MKEMASKGEQRWCPRWRRGPQPDSLRRSASTRHRNDVAPCNDSPPGSPVRCQSETQQAAREGVTLGPAADRGRPRPTGDLVSWGGESGAPGRQASPDSTRPPARMAPEIINMRGCSPGLQYRPWFRDAGMQGATGPHRPLGVVSPIASLLVHSSNSDGEVLRPSNIPPRLQSYRPAELLFQASIVVRG
ncbi:hypothetical protein NDU88_012291 [Pleurodeles waltl]|uniref:Uncharacterized protein n=1 Tax=Pleurodeles waltl TaxID=8319 RepID=A0AAV7QZR2_PLEWA|nr:hypothetical protein NDU88_012291 [Pleurodeles waltl]